MNITRIRQAEKAIGIVKYGPSKQETTNLTFRKSIFCTEDIKAGELITEKNIRVIRPGYGMEPKYYKEVLGQVALCDIKRGTPIKFDMVGRK